MNKGSWVWVPAPKWEMMPEKYYEFGRASITCRLYDKVPAKMIRWCRDNNYLPPPRMKGERLILHIEAKMTSPQIPRLG